MRRNILRPDINSDLTIKRLPKDREMKREEQFINNVTYSDVARALSRDFSRVFCVNTDTDVYVEFIPHEIDEELDIRTIGNGFKDIVQSFESSVYTPDLDTFRTAVTRQNILSVLKVDDSFTLNYRMMIDERPTHVILKVTRLHKEDPSHVLFALGNTDAHMHRLALYEGAMSSQLTFAAVSEAMTSDYDCIFFVDTQTGEYIEFSSSELYQSLNIPPSGDDFFELCRNDLVHIIYEEDKDIFLRSFDRQNLLDVLSSDHLPLLSFRVVLDQTPIHVLVKITKMKQIDDHHIVLGLSNIEANLPRIQKYEQMRAIANRDTLTGVKSKHAFSVDEERIDKEITQGKATPFAVVVCDVNGLKMINDTRGHQAGDDYLRNSCKMICNVFSHSPVYRVGGDEFAALLMGRDYQSRYALVQELHNLSTIHIGTDDAVVSCGMTEYAPDQDHCLRDIFERADAIMYKDKMHLKSLGAATREDETVRPGQDIEDIPFINIRKHILIADDQEINRKILGELLEDEYDILKASNGVETMEILHKQKDKIALVLLDLYMPKMNGQEVLRQMQVDEELMSIPVVMLTVDPDAELDSLKLGAMDFISKPYPDINIVKARIAKCIELSENRDLIKHTQRDKLTGLLHFDYFIRYVERFDQQYSGTALDALVCDIEHFHSVNEQYGRQFGDLVLRDIGINIRKLARKTGGIGCRQGADTFFIYCPHRNDYEQLIKKFQKDLFVEKDTADKVRLRYGVFSNADQEGDIEKRFVHAKAAADSIANDPDRICGFYEKSND